MVQSLFSLWTGKMAKTKVGPLEVIEVEEYINDNAKKHDIIDDENETSGMCGFHVMHVSGCFLKHIPIQFI